MLVNQAQQLSISLLKDSNGSSGREVLLVPVRKTSIHFSTIDQNFSSFFYLFVYLLFILLPTLLIRTVMFFGYLSLFS